MTKRADVQITTARKLNTPITHRDSSANHSSGGICFRFRTVSTAPKRRSSDAKDSRMTRDFISVGRNESIFNSLSCRAFSLGSTVHKPGIEKKNGLGFCVSVVTSNGKP